MIPSASDYIYLLLFSVEDVTDELTYTENAGKISKSQQPSPYCPRKKLFFSLRFPFSFLDEGLVSTCSAVKSGSSLTQETMIECISSCSLSSSSSDASKSKLSLI